MLIRRTCRFGDRTLPTVTIIDASGNLDDPGAYQLGAVVERTATAGCRAVVVDFRGVWRLGVAGLGAVLDMCSTAQRRGVTLKAVCPSGHRLDLLVLAKLVTCIDVYPSEAEALAAFDVGADRSASRSRISRVA
jgi:anti-anti-sigma factor